MKTQTYIGIKLQIEGMHSFPGASSIFGNEVEFLEVRHRHNFGIIAKAKVNHDERDREFILVQREVRAYIERIYGRPAEFKAMSCEAIARDIMETFDFDYVSVDEDGENFAEIIKL